MPVPFVLVAAVQPLEDLEDALEVLGVEADAVVGDAQDAAPARRLGGAAVAGSRPSTSAATRTTGGCVGPVELERVGDQVLQQLADLGRVGLDRGQRADLDAAAAGLDRHLQVGDDLGRDRARDRPARTAAPWW